MLVAVFVDVGLVGIGKSFPIGPIETSRDGDI
jgi:hypothetical protein